ncbi:G protein pathway suppressor 2 [Trinorchestia longiramus]|nr:G protein pathway suppressor 2 [Trinorchestia longiramus]
MVKFAEAEKRGRGGDACGGGGSSSNTGSSSGTSRPFMMMDKPKINRPMLEALKAHIMQERRRKREEQQEVEAEERRRKEQESRKKQHAMTLEETKESITKQTQQLEELRARKHELFQQLKKVLHDVDSKRKERHEQHPSYMKDNDIIAAHQHPQQQPQITALPVHSQQVVFPSGLLHGGVPRSSSLSSLYKISPQPPPPPPPQQQPQVDLVLVSGALLVAHWWRLVLCGGIEGGVYLSSQASSFYHGPPNPPPPSHHSQPPPHHHQAPPSCAHHPQPPPASHHQPSSLHHPSSQASHHPSSQASHHPSSQPPHHQSSQASHHPSSQAPHHPSSQTAHHHPPAHHPPAHHPPPSQYNLGRDDKHSAVYGLHSAAREHRAHRTNVATLPVPWTGGLHLLDHKKGGEPEKLYSSAHGLHALPLQQGASVKSGSITSGFPVRQSLPSPSTQAPPSAPPVPHSSVPQPYHPHSSYY